MLGDIVCRMLTVITQSEANLTAALAERDRLLAENARLRERIRLLEKALFGPKSERLLQDPADQQLFADLLREVDELNRDLERSETQIEHQRQAAAPARQRARRNLDQLIPEGLRQEEILVDLPAEEKISLETGEPLVQIGADRVRKLAVKPAEYYVKVFVTPRYADPADPSRGVLTAGAPDFAIPGGTFDESFLAEVVVNKVALHLPLYRQEERLHNLGIEVSRQTLSRLYIAAAEVLRPLWELLKVEILARGVIFTDDTPVELQVKGHGKTVTGRMWVYVAGGAGPPLRVFEFTIDRRKTRPLEFLAGFQGYIHADAYKGYDELFRQAGVFECACWMHVRRKFFEALDAPQALRQSVLTAIRRLFRYDRFARHHPDGGEALVLGVRREKIAPLIDWLFARTARALREGEVLPASAFAGAIAYLHGLGDALRTFLVDARLLPDNGASERALRPLAIGRKNWLFAGSKGGGDATGILLSLVQTCRALDLDPLVYIEDVLRRLNGHPAHRLDQLLPHHWKPVPTCSA